MQDRICTSEAIQSPLSRYCNSTNSGHSHSIRHFKYIYVLCKHCCQLLSKSLGGLNNNIIIIIITPE